MAEANEFTRKQMTFGQAEGVEPLPSQLQLRELSPALTSRLWLVIHESLEKDTEHGSMGGPSWLGKRWRAVLYDWHTLVEHKYADEFENNARDLIKRTKKLVTSENYVEVFDFVEFVAKHASAPYQLGDLIAWALRSGHAAYRLVDRVIVPVGSDADAQTIGRAFVDLLAQPYGGARSHLKDAAESLTKGNFADSIRNSIHAVESVARILAPDTNTLAPALAALEKRSVLHPALKAGFGNLYGFTNDESGIRHALIDEPNAKVDEIDALYMFGACAAFISYLIGRSRQP